MISGYSKNKSVQLLIALMKVHGIKKVIVSPGTTDLEIVAGLQYSKCFELISCVDERSAAYMACGLAEESKEIVAIICTEATASRNYFPGITEAFYRKLPILVITGVHGYHLIGNLHAQIIDRSVSPTDIFKLKEQLPVIKDENDIWETELKINKAILELTHHGAGPVHIDLPCSNGSYDFSDTELIKVKKIERYSYKDELPDLPKGKIAIFIGSHVEFEREEIEEIDRFCGEYNAVVFCDHTSGFHGKYAVHMSLVANQRMDYKSIFDIDLLIHIGEGTGDGATEGRLKGVHQVWRVSPDGELRDTFFNLHKVFEMNEYDFFKKYYTKNGQQDDRYLKECMQCKNDLKLELDKLPFSNIYVAAILANIIPANSYVYLGVSNTIRAWSFFDFPQSVSSSSNVGCRGIDGAMSSCIGGSFAHRDRLHFCILGDLSFFYDINSLGNREIEGNVRILVINNNGGGIFKLSGAPGYRFFGDEETDKYIAAAGHFGDKSGKLIEKYAEGLGFDYLSARTKEEFMNCYENFVSAEIDNPMIFEIFTIDSDCRDAFDLVSKLEMSTSEKVKGMAKQVLGDKGIERVRRIIRR